jgi:outer membrane beta-barrel protein
VLDPELVRNDFVVPHIPSHDWEVGVFGGGYDTQNFGNQLMGGLRLGYHATEHLFLEATAEHTRISDGTFRRILQGGIFSQQDTPLNAYELSAGWNLFPAEVFLGSRHAYLAAFYLVAGLGTTHFAGTSHQTASFGLGGRLFLTERLALQTDLRDHLYTLDLLGARQSSQNLELSLGLTLFF